MAVDTDAIAGQVTERHDETLEILADRADTVIERWEGPSTTEPTMITDGLRDAIQETGLESDLVGLLETAVGVTDRALAADPVPAPPYLSVTSRGPVLRGPVADGRVVVHIELFRVTEAGRYVRRTGAPLRVEWHSDRETDG